MNDTADGDLRSWFPLFAAASLILLMLGGWLTGLGLGPWYRELQFPPFQPPGWAFTPMWILVLALLAVATSRVAQAAPTRWGAATLAFTSYGAQCVLNAGWSLLFFTMRRPDIALWNLVLLDVVLLLMVLSYGRVSKSAGRLLVPYFLWLLFATAINGWIVVNNPSFWPVEPASDTVTVASTPDAGLVERHAVERNPSTQP